MEQVLEETGDEHYLDELPAHLKPYVKIDTGAMAPDYEVELYVVEASDGGAWVFDPGRWRLLDHPVGQDVDQIVLRQEGISSSMIRRFPSL